MLDKITCQFPNFNGMQMSGIFSDANLMHFL